VFREGKFALVFVTYSSLSHISNQRFGDITGLSSEMSYVMDVVNLVNVQSLMVAPSAAVVADREPAPVDQQIARVMTFPLQFLL
jgi:hypothetical protein